MILNRLKELIEILSLVPEIRMICIDNKRRVFSCSEEIIVISVSQFLKVGAAYIGFEGSIESESIESGYSSGTVIEITASPILPAHRAPERTM